MSFTSLWFERTRALTLELVSWPSVTDSPEEAAFAGRLHALLAAWPYFQARPAQVWLERTRADPRERYNLFALVRGAGPGTVVLTGHYDTVSVEDYGALAPLAFQPEALRPALIADLQANGRSEADQLALADLLSGEFWPGRAILDMKSGLAAGLAVLEKFASAPGRAGNLLFIATPDEEASSHGMRSVAERLPDLERELGLELRAALNLDAASDQGDGRDGRAVFLGSVGKLLPSVLIIGRPTHAGYPFDGVSANLIAAELVRRVECNPELSDWAEGEPAPPPVSLKLGDLKTWYDVTTPDRAWVMFNKLTHARSPEEVLAQMMVWVREALDDTLQLLRERAALYAAQGGPAAALPWTPTVLTFAELKTRAFQQLGGAAEARWAQLLDTLEQTPDLDLPTYNRRLMEALTRWANLDGPAAVVAFASQYYPPVHLDPHRARPARLRAAAAEAAQQLASATGRSFRLRSFFPGISDMSFIGAPVPAESLACLAANTPAWGGRLRFDFAAAARLDLPVINLGPWGRDYHQRLERVHAPDAFGLLPELLWRLCAILLQ